MLAERRAHRVDLRRQAAGMGAPTPVFHGDYLFVQLHHGVVLCCVLKAPHGGALKQNHTVEVTEYIHTPPSDGPSSGFFGSFAPRPNPEYDESRGAKSGALYIRHTAVDRKQILVYNVLTMGGLSTLNPLRVTLGALRALARTRSEFPLPDVDDLPETHTDDVSRAEQEARRQAERDAAAAEARREEEKQERRAAAAAARERQRAQWREVARQFREESSDEEPAPMGAPMLLLPPPPQQPPPPPPPPEVPKTEQCGVHWDTRINPQYTAGCTLRVGHEGACNAGVGPRRRVKRSLPG